MPNPTRTIDTGLTGPVNHAILDSVFGHPSMSKYWKNASLKEQDGKLVIDIKDSWDSGFRGKDDTWIKNWFAGKIKEIVYDEMGGKQWDRNDKTTVSYLSRDYGTNPAIVTVSDAYKAYEILKGRNTKKRYAEPAAAPQEAEVIVNKLLDGDPVEGEAV